MSICWCSYRALPRSRLPPAKTLAPFLYQTATLQLECNAAAHSITRRHASFRPRYQDDVPFEDELQSQSVEDAPKRNTTITGTERIAFEKLYKKFNAPKGPRRETSELDEPLDDWFEAEDAKNTKDVDLSSLFDNVISGRVKADRKPRAPQRSPDLATLASNILKPKVSEAQKKEKRAAELKAAKLKAVQEQERARIRELVENAKTDQELWKILEKEVFQPVSDLDLDNVKQKRRKKKRNSPPSPDKPTFPTSPTTTPYDPLARDISPTDPKVLFHNYSSHIAVAANVLLWHFPTSPLIFSILPFLRSQGRSSYALGATVALYTFVIRATWRQNASYSQICSLLQEMDNSGIEFDMRMLDLLDVIRKHYRAAENGSLGRTCQLVFRMQFFANDMEQLEAWTDLIAQRLGSASERKTHERKLVRRLQIREDTAAALGPLVTPASLKVRRMESRLPSNHDAAFDGDAESSDVASKENTNEDAESSDVVSKENTNEDADKMLDDIFGENSDDGIPFDKDMEGHLQDISSNKIRL